MKREDCCSGNRCDDITTHYSTAKVGELVAVTNRICAAKGTPSVALIQPTGGPWEEVTQRSRRMHKASHADWLSA